MKGNEKKENTIPGGEMRTAFNCELVDLPEYLLSLLPKLHLGRRTVIFTFVYSISFETFSINLQSNYI